MTQPRTTDAPVSIGDTVDGRTMRRTRNRTAVITALLDMIREGDLHPGAAEIADRAGVSHRSIFRYFDDLDDLVRTTIAHAFADAAPLSLIPDLGEGPLNDRIAGLVDARLELFARVDGPMQLARTRAYSIPSIDTEIAEIAELFRLQISQHFADELAGHSHPEHIVDAVLVLTSYDAYTIHRRLLGHAVEDIRTAWVGGLWSLLRP